MPFRRYFEDRGAHHPVAYSMAVLALGMITCMAITAGFSIQASKGAIQQSLAQERRAEAKAAELERAQAAAAAELARKQRVQTQATVCLVVRSMAAAYGEEPPTMPAGKAAAKAWADLAETFRCPERQGT